MTSVDLDDLEARARAVNRRGPAAVAALAEGPDLDHLAGARVDWRELWTHQHDEDDWLIGPVFARGRSHALYAPAKAGKSLFVLDLVAAAATGRPILDRPAGERLRTLYVDLEMTRDDLRERLTDMAYGPDDDLTNLVYYSLPALAPLDTATGGAELVALAQYHAVDLVVIDTVARTLAGEENSADTLRALTRCTMTPLKAAGIAAARIDHAGKDADRGMRGSSAKSDDVDVVWKLTPRDAGRFDLRATHRRMAWVPELVALEQTTDPLGYRLVGDSWPAGTRGAAELLDRLAIPAEMSRRRARDRIAAAGETAPRNEVLDAAQRFRRAEAARLEAPVIGAQ